MQAFYEALQASFTHTMVMLLTTFHFLINISNLEKFSKMLLLCQESVMLRTLNYYFEFDLLKHFKCQEIRNDCIRDNHLS